MNYFNMNFKVILNLVLRKFSVILASMAEAQVLDFSIHQQRERQLKGSTINLRVEP